MKANKEALYEVTFRSGKKLSVFCKWFELYGLAIGRNQTEGFQDITDIQISWSL